MIKKAFVFTLIIFLLTLSGACASYRAAFETGTVSAGTGTVSTETGTVSAETGTPATSALQEQVKEAAETTESSSALSLDKKAALLDEIIRTDAAYSKYDADIFEADYDGDGTPEFFYVFTQKSAHAEDDIGSSAEIWFGDENGVKRVAEWQCIDPDTYGSLRLAGKYYFRYDLAFVTAQQTILLSVKDDNSIDSFNCTGFAEFGDERRAESNDESGNTTDDFTVTSSTYDMVYLKSDDITCSKPLHRFRNP